jgi:hypothetical protein
VSRWEVEGWVILPENVEPWLLVDRLTRLLSWFEHWLGDQRVVEGS